MAFFDKNIEKMIKYAIIKENLLERDFVKFNYFRGETTMRMKRIFLFTLLIALLLTFVACVDNENNAADAGGNAPSESQGSDQSNGESNTPTENENGNSDSDDGTIEFPAIDF